ncbi:hypothetical protein EHQ12_15275 [Leptospira gomenensis]|uniref:Uncharacterized protein n=1 Tax=Leptospira gomenensis TaxID=2484974 RepID=A0A5F1Y6J9_9LEPT|nr:hypothetical protein [Leptospira gomenensis]TGK28951.1 hypothetical protein EHQ17_16450 [Leptospira gomenensis]TGK35412.1 hypothetical protein EHQ12_15275 [Leptospira gomenensis]TGK40710.1 hypothetical protein EHQ07_17795 [Leptospira gomenensis]TGK68446.1 hypothetical protein EHQ13_00260 [Leptospira gomenensis]
MKSSDKPVVSNFDGELLVSTGTLSLISRLLFPITLVEGLLNDRDSCDVERNPENVHDARKFLSEYDPNFFGERKKIRKKGN